MLLPTNYGDKTVAHNETIDLVAGTWVELTSTNVTHIRIQNKSRSPIEIMGTTGAAPSSFAGSITLLPFEIISSDLELGSLFSGAVRLFAFCASAGQASVNHA